MKAAATENGHMRRNDSETLRLKDESDLGFYLLLLGGVGLLFAGVAWLAGWFG